MLADTLHDVSLNCFLVLNFGTLALEDASSPPDFAAFDTFANSDSLPPLRDRVCPVSFSMFLPIAAVSFYADRTESNSEQKRQSLSMQTTSLQKQKQSNL